MSTWAQEFVNGESGIDTEEVSLAAARGINHLIREFNQIDELLGMEGEFVRRMTNGLCNVSNSAKSWAHRQQIEADSEITDARHDRNEVGDKDILNEIADVQKQENAARWTRYNRLEQAWDEVLGAAAYIHEEVTGDAWRPYNPKRNRQGPTATEAAHAANKAQSKALKGQVTILVCGGRDIDEGNADLVNKLFYQLDKLQNRLADKGEQITRVIHGGSKGADYLAGKWAKNRSIRYEVFKAQWEVNGQKDNAAGYKRDIALVDQNPNYAVVFPQAGNNIVKLCEERGIAVWKAPLG
jgi:hypothetical protein